ncbi:MAG: GIY-YIG nuclease family protein [Rhizobiaceae bacterium]|nr:GIY-YIG nuclease family protein [Rhizobiaceae bacterium]
MKGPDRKAALAAYKQQKPSGGVFAVRSAASGHRWVGAAPNVSTIQTRLWFELRQGGSANKAMQAEWNAAGGDGFSFEVLEAFDGETAPYPQGMALRQRIGHWRAELQADAL